MLKFSGHGIAAAASVVVAVVSISCGPGGSVAPTGTPTQVPLPSTSAMELPESADLAPGTYYIEGSGIGPISRLTFTVPAGWTATPPSQRNRDSRIWGLVYKDSGSGGVWLSAATAGRVYGDICQWRGTDVDGGTTAAQLVAALGKQTGGHVSTPTDTSVSGFDAKRIELNTPDQEGALCHGGDFHYWADPPPTGDVSGLWANGNQTDVVYAVDVAGNRSVIDAAHDSGATSQDLAELNAVVASVQIEP